MAVLAIMVEAVITWLKIPWSGLQGKPSPNDVLNEVKDWIPPNDAKANEARINALNKALTEIGEIELLAPGKDVAEMAKKVGEATTKYIKKERDRRAIIRLLAIGFGILFAWLFQIDTLQLLASLFDPAQALWQSTLGPTWAHVVGLVLGGLAASAGSSFWHDQSARLRKLKAASEAVSGLVETR